MPDNEERTIADMPRAERPLSDDGSPLAAFALELRRLRHQAGSPSYRELARRVHYSSTTLADAAGGRKLPTLEVTLAFVRACGGDEREWELRWRAVLAPPVVEAEPDERQLNFQVLVACLLAVVMLSLVGLHHSQRMPNTPGPKSSATAWA